MPHCNLAASVSWKEGRFKLGSTCIPSNAVIHSTRTAERTTIFNHPRLKDSWFLCLAPATSLLLCPAPPIEADPEALRCLRSTSALWWCARQLMLSIFEDLMTRSTQVQILEARLALIHSQPPPRSKTKLVSPAVNLHTSKALGVQAKLDRSCEFATVVQAAKASARTYVGPSARLSETLASVHAVFASSYGLGSDAICRILSPRA